MGSSLVLDVEGSFFLLFTSKLILLYHTKHSLPNEYYNACQLAIENHIKIYSIMPLSTSLQNPRWTCQLDNENNKNAGDNVINNVIIYYKKK